MLYFVKNILIKFAILTDAASLEDGVFDKENDIPCDQTIESSVDPSGMEVCQEDEHSSEPFVPDSQVDNDSGKNYLLCGVV